jgi:hypothetical protein
VRGELAAFTSEIRERSGRVHRLGSSLRRGGRMAEGFVHTVHVNGRWVNALEGQDRLLLGTFDTKEEAVEAGREEASRRLTEHLIHDEDLSIAERNSYRGDPADRPTSISAPSILSPEEP